MTSRGPGLSRSTRDRMRRSKHLRDLRDGAVAEVPDGLVPDQGTGLDQRGEPFLQEQRIALDACAHGFDDRFACSRPHERPGQGPLGKGESSSRRSRQLVSASKALSRAGTPASGSGRLVASRKSGPSLATFASSSVSRSDVGSAQCRSSKTKTVGPLPTSCATKARIAAKVARWSPSGLSRAR